MWSKIKSTINAILICFVSLCFVSCVNIGKNADRVLGINKTIVYEGCKYVPQYGLSCWMWSNKGMECVGKYYSLVLFNNTVSEVYAPMSNDTDPRIYVNAYGSGNIRWLKEGFEFPSPIAADFKSYVVRVEDISIAGDINSLSEIIKTGEGISGDGFTFVGNVELYLNEYEDTYFHGRLYMKNNEVYFHDEGYSNLYYPVDDQSIKGTVSVRCQGDRCQGRCQG